MAYIKICMAASLLLTFARASVLVLLSLPQVLLQSIIMHVESAKGVEFYEGTIRHVRRKPVYNAFTYPVRMALIDLDGPPHWWRKQARFFLPAAKARNLAGTSGAVKLLTNPVTAGYTQNPISVYYCYSRDGALTQCIAEVTNTPWAARVIFLFNPEGQTVPKALHVSPFMDMHNTWQLKATSPGKRVSLLVAASHPEHKDYFLASLQMQISDRPSSRSEQAGFSKLLRYGFQPQRDGLLIYWQAVKLLWKRAPFYGPPAEQFKEEAEKSASNPTLPCGDHFIWKPAEEFPWVVN